MHGFTDSLFPSFPAESWIDLVLGHVLQELGLHTSAMVLRNTEGETEPQKTAMDTMRQILAVYQ